MKKILIGTWIIVALIMIAINFNTIKIRGKVNELVNICNSTYPVKILKAIGVKKINSVTYEFETIIEVNVNDDLNIEILPYPTGWTVHNQDNIKKLNEIDSKYSDDYADYYSEYQPYITDLYQTKVYSSDELKKVIDNTSVSFFEANYEMFLITFIFWLFLPIVVLIIKIIRNKAIEKKAKEQSFLDEHNASYVLKNIEYNDGIDTFIKNDKCNIFIQSDKLLIFNLNNNSSASILYTKIVACGVFDDKQISKNVITKNGSVIGRGVLGGFFFGPIGAIVGGMSGLNSKTNIIQTEQSTYYLVINYKPNSSKKVRSISFKTTTRKLDLENLSDKIKEQIEIDNIDL